MLRNSRLRHSCEYIFKMQFQTSILYLPGINQHRNIFITLPIKFKEDGSEWHLTVFSDHFRY